MLIGLSIFFGSLLLIAIFGYLLPKKVTVSRSITIQASPESIFKHISDLHQFKIWNPWSEKDPNIQVQITGQGKGSKYQWKGNRKVREGSLTIVELYPNEKVDFELRFGANPTPSFTTLSIHPQRNFCEVSWTMESDMGSNPAGRYMGLFMEKFVGRDYEKGLENLRNVCETEKS